MRAAAHDLVAPAPPAPWRGGTAQAVGSHHPFALAGEDAAWLIDDGAVDVFAVELDAAGAPRHRQHLFTAAAGELLCGFAPGAGTDILAVATADSAVRRIAVAELLAPHAAHAAAVAALVDGWVSHLAGALVAALRPRAHGAIHPGDEQTLAAGASVSSAGATWVEVVEGELQLDGDDAFPPVGPGLVALAGRAWLTARTPAVLRGHGTRALLDERRLAAALAGFHQRFLGAADVRRGLRAAAHEHRLAEQRRRDRRLLAGSLASLASLLERRPSATAAHDETPAYAACRLVCHAAGIDLGPPPPGLAHHPDPVGLIVDDARLRIRRIALREGWWRRDVGPLFARAPDGRPLALLPRPRGGYELHDVARGTHRRLTDDVSAELAPFAVMFYRRLPARAIGARDLLAFALRGRGRDLARIAVIGLAAGVLTIATPLATGLVFDAIIPGAARGQLLYLALGLLVGALASALFEITRSLSLLRLEGRTGAALQAAIWDRLIDLPVAFFRNQTAGDLADRAAGVDTIRHDLSASLVTMVLATGFGLINLALLLYVDLSLGSWATLLFAVPVVVAAASAARLLGRYRAATQIQGRLAGLVLQLVRGIAKLRVAGAEVRAYARWAELLHQQRWLALRTRAPLQVFVAVYPVAATLVLYALVLGRDGAMATGAFIAFMSAFHIVLFSLLQTAGSTLAVLHVVPTFHRLAPILAARSEIDERKSDPGELDGEIEIAHVSFRYGPGTPYVLGDVSLHIRPGEFVAIVGPSGSGKSTLLRLLLGFERPTAGHVYYGGQDLEHVDLRKVRRQIGVVLQTSQLMPGDIFTNVVGSSDLGRDEATLALRMAGFGPDLAALPMGLHTVLSEGGSTLSGGQRQRLLIARAIVRRPRILYFDEATSALDNETQAHVADSIAGLEATRVVVAHRLSTIRHADRIVVLDHGRVVQSGTYAELIAQPGLFAELARRQLL